MKNEKILHDFHRSCKDLEDGSDESYTIYDDEENTIEYIPSSSELDNLTTEELLNMDMKEVK